MKALLMPIASLPSLCADKASPRPQTASCIERSLRSVRPSGGNCEIRTSANSARISSPFSWLCSPGYGFRLWRILVVYALLVAVFALAYWSVGIQYPHDLSYWQALAVSITAFHGRVFPSPFTKDALDSAQMWVTASEAICGLVIEGVFIAMLTQRFFNR